MARKNPADTPLMRQFLEVKERHSDAILFFRMGDFYEMFFEDAVVAAGALDLTLTSRNKGKDDAIPMAGVPHHAGRGYIARLTELGHKVVICEQVEDPKLAKGLVKREVVQIVTPGVVIDDEVLDPKSARYLASITVDGERGVYGLAYLDASTGEFRATEVLGLADLLGELCRVAPREILATAAELSGPLAAVRERYRDAAYTPIDRDDEPAAVLESALAGSLGDLGLAALPWAAQAAADTVRYARATQPAGALPLTRLQVYQAADAVVLDDAAVANLELVSTLMGGKKAGSLLSVIDATATAPGGRLLRRWLLYPLVSVAPIRRRQDAVEYLVDHAALRAAVREQLKGIYDLERLAGRVSLGVASPRDLGQLVRSLSALPELARAAAGHATGDASALEIPELLAADDALLATLADLHAELERTLVDDPPPVTKDGGIVRDGFCAVVDENRRLADGGKETIAAIELRERERTGIHNLKIKYNRVFGYYLEVTRSQLSRVPDDYVRKQTIATAERFVTGELAELEEKVLSAQERLVAREAELFRELVARAATDLQSILGAASYVATLDVCAGLAEVASDGGYVRPTVDDSEILEVRDGRHPVVERSVAAGAFVPNDCHLDPAAEQLVLITGPNMAGKSTYMRQVAHIALLAQMGSFVPARAARVGLVDRIFTRVGASDNLAQGESTFMVEMRETSAILRGATRRSLVVLDEVGRGTSTFDGVSIAWAVSEYLHDAIGCRTLFATHYHELSALAESRPRVRNVSVAVREHGGEIVFLRQVVPGGESRSYGIDVARLAGLPRSVVARARQLLAELEHGQLCGTSSQLSLFGAIAGPPAASPAAASPTTAAAAAVAEVCEKLRGIDLQRTTPLDALNLLAELRDQLS